MELDGLEKCVIAEPSFTHISEVLGYIAIAVIIRERKRMLHS